MPLGSKDAEKLLQILWEAKIKALQKKDEENADIFQPNEEKALSNAISMLHCFITDVTPSFTHLINNFNSSVALQVLSGEAEVQHVEFVCSTTRDPGLLFESYSSPLTMSTSIIYVSHIETGTVADNVDIFQRGDIILEINGHPLARVAVERARWLMRSAARSGKVGLAMVTCDGRQVPFHVRKRDVKSSLSVQQYLNNMIGDKRAHQVANEEMVPKSKFTRSIGSLHSDQKTFADTIEKAAEIGRSSFKYSNKRLQGKNRQLVKATITKHNGELGLRLVGGKGSKFGDLGIFICSVEAGKPADKEGSLKKGDEVLMINNKSVVGFRVEDVKILLREADDKVTIIAAAKAAAVPTSYDREDSLGATQSSVSLASNTEYEVRKLLAEQQTLSPPSLKIMEFIDHEGKTRPSLTSEQQPAVHQLNRTRRATDEPQSSQTIELKRLSNSPSLVTLSRKPKTQWGRLSTSKIHSPSKQSSLKTIVFVKGVGRPLGFSLCGGRGSKLGNNAGIFVKAIQDSGEAAKDGRLKVGDEIMFINEQSLEGFTHKMAAHKIKGLNGVVSLKVKSDPENIKVINKLLRKHSSVQGTAITVTLDKGETEGLGLEIAGLTNDRDEFGIFIKHIQPFSPADKCKLLHRADQLISVNEISLLDVSVTHAIWILDRVPGGMVTLQVVRPKKVEALVQLLAAAHDETTDKRHLPSKLQGSFRMAVKEQPYHEASLTNPPLTSIDQDILNLFSSPSEVDLEGSGDDTHQETQFMETPSADDFPLVSEELKDAETKGNTILQSMTPLLSRPSIAKQYSTDQSPGNSPPLAHKRGSIEMVARRGSDLVNNVQSPPLVNETAFTTSQPLTDPHLIGDGSSSMEHSSEVSPPDSIPPDVPLPDVPPPDVPLPDSTPPLPDVPLPDSIAPDVPLPDVPPPDSMAPDVPLPDVPLPDSMAPDVPLPDSSPPDVPPSDSFSPNVPPPDSTPADVPVPNSIPIDVPPPDSTPPDVPPPDSTVPLPDSTVPLPDVPPPDSSSPDVPLPDVPPPDSNVPLVDLPLTTSIQQPPHGYECHVLTIDKQKGKKGIGITLSSSRIIDVYYPVVKRLLPNSVGGRYGLQRGDMIVSIGEQCVRELTAQEVMNAITEAPSSFNVTIFRNTSESALTPSVYGAQSVAYTESVSSLLSEDEPRQQPSLTPRFQSLTDVMGGGSPLLVPYPSIPLNVARVHPPEPSSPPPSPTRGHTNDTEDVPLSGTTHPVSTISSPPPPSSPPPSPPPPSTPPPSSVPVPPPPSTPPPSPLPPLSSDPPPPSTPPPSPPPSTPPPSATFPSLSDPPPPRSPPPSPPPSTPPLSSDPPPPSTPPPSPPPSTPPPSPPSSFPAPVSSFTPSDHPTPPPPPASATPITTNEPFTIKVSKSSIFGLGLTVHRNEAGSIEVKQIGSRSPLAKEGTLKVHDILLSINGKDVAGLTEKQIDGMIKALPKGNVTIMAMKPPQQKKEDESTSTATVEANDNDDGAVVKVQLTRPPNTPLGIIVEGGSDSPLQNIYISSLKPGTAAFNSGQFQRGDQIIMCGDTCLVGLSNLEAWDVLNKVPNNVEFVLTRRKIIPELLELKPSSSPTLVSNTRPAASRPKLKRRESISLFFSQSSMEDIRTGDMYYDIEHDEDSSDMKQEPEKPAITTVEEKFTVVLTREDDSQKLGLGIHGGIDNPSLPEIYVKVVDASGLAGINGMIHRGDRICSVNGESLTGVSRKTALQILKKAGNTVTLEVARQVTNRSSNSNKTEQRSNQVTPPPIRSVPPSGSPSPVMRSGRTSGMKNRISSVAGRMELLGKAEGIKVVELHKGPTGLGILLNGTRIAGEFNIPITVKEVLPGGVAYKSNKISIGDELIEANNISFERVSYNEAIKILKDLPQGPVHLTLLDKNYVIPHNGGNE